MICFDLGKIFPYLVPTFPIFTRIIIHWLYPTAMAKLIPEIEQQRDTYRTIVLALMGFSFSATIALLVLGDTVTISLKVPMFYALTSFIGYYVVLNAQQFKTKIWKDNFSDGFYESANMSLICVIISLVLSSNTALAYKLSLSALCAVVWIIDYISRLYRVCGYYKNHR